MPKITEIIEEIKAKYTSLVAMQLWKSIKKIDLSQVLQRFGLALIFSVFASVLVIYMIHTEHSSASGFFETEHLVKLIFCSVIGFLLAIIWRLITEYYIERTAVKWLSLLLVFLPVTAYYLVLLPDDLENQMVVPKFIGLILFLHGVISFIPFLVKNKIAAFWEYNRSLFSQFFFSAFFSLVIYAGISLAIFALVFLFGMSHFDGKIYGYWFVLVAGIFHPIYFLSHFPKELRSLAIQDLPKAFIILVVYILIPISLLYLLILYAYGAKIAIEMSLPQGLVSNLVLSFSIIGILTYLLNYMIPTQHDLGLSKFFRRYFFYLMLIPIALLFMAIYVRIDSYGITEPRYIVAILSVWLLLVSSYIIISKVDNIKVIPISLCVAVIIALFGPLNMFDISIKNQLDRLANTLSEQGILTEGRFNKGVMLDANIWDQIDSQFDFLIDRKQGMEQLRKLSDNANYQYILSADADLSKYERRKQIREFFDDFLIVTDRPIKQKTNTYLKFYALNEEPVDISDYQLLFSISTGRQMHYDKFTFSHERRSNNFNLSIDGRLISYNIDDFVNKLSKSEIKRLPVEEMTYELDTLNALIKMSFSKIDLDKKNEKYKINTYEGFLFINEYGKSD